jgi:hypothetical protein
MLDQFLAKKSAEDGPEAKGDRLSIVQLAEITEMVTILSRSLVAHEVEEDTVGIADKRGAAF